MCRMRAAISDVCDGETAPRSHRRISLQLGGGIVAACALCISEGAAFVERGRVGGEMGWSETWTGGRGWLGMLLGDSAFFARVGALVDEGEAEKFKSRDWNHSFARLGLVLKKQAKQLKFTFFLKQDTTLHLNL